MQQARQRQSLLILSFFFLLILSILNFDARAERKDLIFAEVSCCDIAPRNLLKLQKTLGQ